MKELYFKFTNKELIISNKTVRLNYFYEFSIKSVTDHIEITNTSLIPIAIFYYIIDKDNFCYSTSFDDVKTYLILHNITIDYTDDYTYYENKPDIIEIQKCKTIKKITKYNKLNIYINGTYVIQEFKDEIKTIPLNCDLWINTLIQWIRRYTDLVNQLDFTPTLTGGLDTRILTYFWKNNTYNSYYLKAIKNDHKNNLYKGLKEIEISQKVLDRLHKNLKRIEYFTGYTYSGLFSEMDNFDDNFLYEFVSYHFSNRDLCTTNTILPFLDSNYLKLAKPSFPYMKVFLAKLLCPNLLDIEIYSHDNCPVYFFEDTFGRCLSKLVEFRIRKYNLNNRL